MAFRDRLRSAISSSSRSSTTSKSSTSSSTSITYTASNNKSSHSHSSRTRKPSSDKSTHKKSSQGSGFFRSKRNRTDEEPEWVHPPLKYAEPPDPAVVNMLTAWYWNAGSGIRRRDTDGSDISPTTLIGWI